MTWSRQKSLKSWITNPVQTNIIASQILRQSKLANLNKSKFNIKLTGWKMNLNLRKKAPAYVIPQGSSRMANVTKMFMINKKWWSWMSFLLALSFLLVYKETNLLKISNLLITWIYHRVNFQTLASSHLADSLTTKGLITRKKLFLDLAPKR